MEFLLTYAFNFLYDNINDEYKQTHGYIKEIQILKFNKLIFLEDIKFDSRK